MKSDADKTGNVTQSPERLNTKAFIRRYQIMVYGGLLLIILLTAVNAFYLSKQIKSQLLNEERHRGLETLLTLSKTVSITLNHVDEMRYSLESAREYPELIPNMTSFKFLADQSLHSPPGALWDNLPEDVREKVGQIYLQSNHRDISFDVLTLLSMMPEVVATHRQHADFQWSYYYDADKVLTQIYPWIGHQDMLTATGTENMDDALRVIYEAGGTYPLQLVNPTGNPARGKVWTTPYMDAGGKGMMISLLAPVYQEDNFIGAVGTDITLKVLDSILTKKRNKIGRLVLVDKNGIVVADSGGTLTNTEENISHPDVLSLLDVGEAHNVTSGELQHAKLGYWVAYQLDGTPWNLVLEITNSEIQTFTTDAILPNLVMAAIFAVLLVILVLYQHRHYSQPALQLAKFTEELPETNDIAIPHTPTKWRHWFESAARTEQERREHLNTIEQQTLQLEHRVKERTQELQQALETLKTTQNELVQSEKLAGLGSLVAGIAHELNTPIGNALMLASSQKEMNDKLNQAVENGLRRSDLDDHLEKTLLSSASIENNLHRAAELITSFKQVAVDQSSYQRREFDLPEILHELKITMMPSLSRDNVILEEDFEPDIKMNSYPGPLTQVLMNLLSNAVTHAFSDQDDKRIIIRCTLVDEHHASITVTDNGRGIQPEYLSKVFDPFFTTRLGHGSSGLGLNISYNLVMGLLCGEITVASEVDNGTCFTINLPLVLPETNTE
ncbi:ATP-binding protein [Vibrio tapetis]|uniref:histidine kinase n=1 Tax=Vibrio tapetis subsp. tapetis TaxID=1671868 RepID=A0A2N8ZAG4_9VIBR|nr:ATP-binding protein [Vibrio tapetis]SON48890.1 Cellulose binding type IV [Vibrio tapetis subsp. tapetis]